MAKYTGTTDQDVLDKAKKIIDWFDAKQSNTVYTPSTPFGMNQVVGPSLNVIPENLPVTSTNPFLPTNPVGNVGGGTFTEPKPAPFSTVLPSQGFAPLGVQTSTSGVQPTTPTVGSMGREVAPMNSFVPPVKPFVPDSPFQTPEEATRFSDQVQAKTRNSQLNQLRKANGMPTKTVEEDAANAPQDTFTPQTAKAVMNAGVQQVLSGKSTKNPMVVQHTNTIKSLNQMTPEEQKSLTPEQREQVVNAMDRPIQMGIYMPRKVPVQTTDSKGRTVTTMVDGPLERVGGGSSFSQPQGRSGLTADEKRFFDVQNAQQGQKMDQAKFALETQKAAASQSEVTRHDVFNPETGLTTSVAFDKQGNPVNAPQFTSGQKDMNWSRQVGEGGQVYYQRMGSDGKPITIPVPNGPVAFEPITQSFIVPAPDGSGFVKMERDVNKFQPDRMLGNPRPVGFQAVGDSKVDYAEVTLQGPMGPTTKNVLVAISTGGIGGPSVTPIRDENGGLMMKDTMITEFTKKLLLEAKKEVSIRSQVEELQSVEKGKSNLAKFETFDKLTTFMLPHLSDVAKGQLKTLKGVIKKAGDKYQAEASLADSSKDQQVRLYHQNEAKKSLEQVPAWEVVMAAIRSLPLSQLGPQGD